MKLLVEDGKHVRAGTMPAPLKTHERTPENIIKWHDKWVNKIERHIESLDLEISELKWYNFKRRRYLKFWRKSSTIRLAEANKEKERYVKANKNN
jgi:hypothetical protein